MANITPTWQKVGEDCWRVTWGPMTQTGSDVGLAVGLPEFADRSVQVKGTLGAGGTVVFEGSNDDGTTYHTLSNTSDVASSFNALRTDQMAEVTQLMRPRVTGGDGTTSLTVVMLMRKQRSGKAVP